MNWEPPEYDTIVLTSLLICCDA